MISWRGRDDVVAPLGAPLVGIKVRPPHSQRCFSFFLRIISFNAVDRTQFAGLDEPSHTLMNCYGYTLHHELVSL